MLTLRKLVLVVAAAAACSKGGTSAGDAGDAASPPPSSSSSSSSCTEPPSWGPPDACDGPPDITHASCRCADVCPLPDLDTKCACGPSARDVLAKIASSSTAPFKRGDGTLSGTVALTVTYSSGPMQCELHSQKVFIPLTLGFTTSDGEFAESVPSTLDWAPITPALEVQGVLLASQLKGRFSPTYGPDEKITFHAYFDADPPVGYVEEEGAAGGRTMAGNFGQ